MKDLNELGLKDITLNFDTGELDDIQLVQGDTKTRGFNVELVSNSGEVIPPNSNITLKLFGTNLNDPTKTYYTVANVIDDKYQVFFSTDMLGKMGKVEFQLALYQGSDKLIQSNTYISDVTKSLCNGGATGKDLVVDFTKLEKALERVDTQEKAYKDSLQKQEVIKTDIDKKQKQVSTDTTAVKKIRRDMEGVMSAEASRVSAEKTRQSQESTRQKQEGIRESKFKEAEENRSKIFEEKEAIRQSEETKRQSQESTRQSQESTRKSQEAQRVEAEKKRVSAESARASAESTRSSQESTRQSEESKRKSNESARVSAENTRKSQETTRQSQETQRVEAEKKRKSTFEGWSNTMQGVIPNATRDKTGVVKVEGTTDETAPYTVLSVGVIQEELNSIAMEIGNAGKSLVDIKQELIGKADKSHNHKLTTLEGFDKLDNEISKINNDLTTNYSNLMTNIETFSKEFVSELDNKADKSHRHSKATAISSGFMSARDKKIVDAQIFNSNQIGVFKIIDGKPAIETVEV